MNDEEFEKKFHVESALYEALQNAWRLLPPNIDGAIKLAEAMQNALKNYDSLTDALVESASNGLKAVQIVDLGAVNFTMALSSGLEAIITSAFSAAEPYMTVEAKERVDEVVAPKLKGKLSFSDKLTIFGILVSIYFGILAALPNPQLERIAAQNETIIEQNESMIENQTHIIELHEADNDAELRKALDTLTDTINLLIDDIEDTRNELQEVNN